MSQSRISSSGFCPSLQSDFSGSRLSTSIAALITPIAASRHIPQKVIAFSVITFSPFCFVGV